MAQCPHCHYDFIGWYPLKDHLLTDSSCSVLEKQEQRRIFVQQEQKHMRFNASHTVPIIRSVSNSSTASISSSSRSSGGSGSGSG